VSLSKLPWRTVIATLGGVFCISRLVAVDTTLQFLRINPGNEFSSDVLLRKLYLDSALAVIGLLVFCFFLFLAHRRKASSDK
jgi:hypothetical protein